MAVSGDPILESLDEDQRRAVAAPQRYVRVVAAAGAGKTEVLTRRVLYLIARRGAQPEEIAAFTFTERAAQEMKDRIHQRAEGLLRPELRARLGRIFVGTIHGFCAHVLRDFFGYGHFEILDEEQETAFVMQRGWELGLHLLKPRRWRYADQCLGFLRSLEVVENELLDPDEVEREAGPGDTDARRFAEAARRYWDLLEEHRILTFGRLIRLAVERVRERPDRLPYRHFLVDEYQDIHNAREQLIFYLAASPSCETAFVVGDLRQSDPRCFERFARRFGAATYRLRRNRRSAREIIAVANAVARYFAEEPLRDAMEPREEAPDGAVLALPFATPEEETRWIARAAKEAAALAGGYRGMAILLRSVATSGGVFAEALREEGGPLSGGRKAGALPAPRGGSGGVHLGVDGRPEVEAGRAPDLRG